MKKRIILIAAILLAVTAVLAVLHLTTRTPEIEGAVLVNGESVQLTELELSRVTGTIVNGKGEEKQVDTQGILISEICVEFSEATVTATDEYSAVVDEQDSENAYLIVEEDGSLRLVVFGDENARRDVKNVSRIDWK